tara:strand:- start:607 stop:900 length:294 start_codon:yes stop_codon:yes gene_type:complete
MTAYVIANLDVTDPAVFSDYGERVLPIIKKFGGRYLVRGGSVENLEGEHGFKRLVILEFPDKTAAKNFYDSQEYAPLFVMRQASAKSTLALVEGLDR